MISFPNPGIIAGPRSGGWRLFYTSPTPSIVTATGGNYTIGLPPGEAGDLLVAMIGFRNTQAFSMPSGWTEIYQGNGGNTSPFGPVSGLMAYKIRGASEPTPTFNRTGGGAATGWIMGYRPASGSVSFDAYSQSVSGGTTNAVSCPGLTVAADGSLLVAMVANSTFTSSLLGDWEAAGLAAGPTTGVFSLATQGSRLADDPWSNSFLLSYNLGGQITTQSAHLAQVPAGATGAFSATYGGTACNNLTIAASFTRA